MMQVDVRPYDEERDLPRLLSGLREDDLIEYLAIGILPADLPDALRGSLRRAAKAVTLDTDRGLAAVAAVAPDGPYSANAWVSATPLLTEHPRAFYRVGRDILTDFARDYRLLWNVKYGGHTRHINWLRRMGFVFIDTYGGFHTFARIT